MVWRSAVYRRKLEVVLGDNIINVRSLTSILYVSNYLVLMHAHIDISSGYISMIIISFDSHIAVVIRELLATLPLEWLHDVRLLVLVQLVLVHELVVLTKRVWRLIGRAAVEWWQTKDLLCFLIS